MTDQRRTWMVLFLCVAAYMLLTGDWESHTHPLDVYTIDGTWVAADGRRLVMGNERVDVGGGCGGVALEGRVVSHGVLGPGEIAGGYGLLHVPHELDAHHEALQIHDGAGRWHYLAVGFVGDDVLRARAVPTQHALLDAHVLEHADTVELRRVSP